MKITVVLSKVRLFSILILSALLLTNCQKPPVPEFSYSPSVNPEAGDSIFFTNESIEALTYEWNFGNNSTSSDENPFTIYKESGEVEVTLTATNDAGSESISKAITINDPTVLAFFVYAEEDTSILSGCELWVYTNEADYNQFAEPQFFEISDDEGIAVFMNMEPQEYYVVAVKELENGVWLSGGKTNPIEQNKSIIYYIPCVFYPDTEKKAMHKKIAPDLKILDN